MFLNVGIFEYGNIDICRYLDLYFIEPLLLWQYFHKKNNFS